MSNTIWQNFTGKNPDDYEAFVYEILNCVNGRKYIGFKNVNTKRSWQDYWGTSKYLKQDIDRIGKKYFIRTILKVFQKSYEAAKYERSLLEEANVGDNPMYYNKRVTTLGTDRAGITLTADHKSKVGRSGKQNGFYGRTHTPETKERISAANKGKRTGKDNGFFGKSHSPETIEYLREINTGPNHPRYGVPRSDEVKNKISKGRKGIPQPKLTCPHCGLTGGARNMKVYHFDNCKTLSID